MKKVLACLLALVMVGSISGCSSVNKVDTFDEACELIDEIKEVNGREEIELERQISNLLSELGLHTSGEATYSKYYKDEKLSADKEFVTSYLENHSQEELFQNIEKLFNFYDIVRYDEMNEPKNITHDFEAKNGCICEKLTTFLDTALSVTEIETVSFDESMKNTDGFYTKNPSATPQPYKKEVSGTFFDSNGENRNTQTKTNIGTVEYFGDFAVAYHESWHYDEGRFEWVNGQFIDELPNWRFETSFALYYKGIDVFYTSDINKIQEFYDMAKQFKLLIIGEDIYSIMPNIQVQQENSNNHHTHTYFGKN